MEPRYLLIVTVPRGVMVRDTPRPQSQGGRSIRSEAVGAQLYAYGIHKIEGVPYAMLVPRNPTKPEWVRVEEVDGSVVYVDVIDLKSSPGDDELVKAIHELTDAVTLLATSERAIARK